MMEMSKYYDWGTHSPFRNEDGCPLHQWLAGHQGRFAVHPKGFPLFLPPDDIARLDSLAGSDPCSVLRTKNSRPHKRRFLLTVQMIRQVGDSDSASFRILDVGCGGGHITAEIKRAFPAAEISAVDCSVSAIECAKGLYPDIDFAVADAYCLPYRPEYFDCVVSNNMWEHLPDPMRFLAAVSRVLKEGGALVLSTPNRYRVFNLLRIIRGRVVGLRSPNHVTEYSIGQVMEQLRFGGFAVRKVDAKGVESAAGSLKTFVVNGIVAPLIESYLWLVGSHHGLAEPAFYLAIRTAKPRACAGDED